MKTSALARTGTIAAIVVLGAAASIDVAELQRAQYRADVAKTIVELQQFRRVDSIPIERAAEGGGSATLVNVNPRINDWYLLSLNLPAGTGTVTYHLENPRPRAQTLTLDPAQPDGVRIVGGDWSFACRLWDADGSGALAQARRSGLPYAPICEDRLYVRNAVPGTYTHIERITNFLRDHVWGGEKIVILVRETFFRDAFIERGATVGSGRSIAQAGPGSAPASAAVEPGLAAETVVPEHLGIDPALASGALSLGHWYPVSGAAGIFLSVMEPGAVDAAILSSRSDRVAQVDAIEARALDYLVAFDLAQFEVAFALGTDHPRVGWSERVLDAVREPTLPGPDGIGSVAPLVVNGMVSPAVVGRMSAAFVGGFKREHGAFRYGELALRDHGTHYGFVEHGAVFSKLMPGLATLYVTDDGSVEMASWSDRNDTLLERVRYARQNGVPLIDYDPQTGVSVPGALVNRWGAGNWSGSVDERLRTLRAGACLQQSERGRFLVYGYFSTATPSAMVRVFQAYGCRYAMHLDMNALEHSYLAVYTHTNGQLVVRHLVEGMSEVDRKGPGEPAPRFLSFPDDRDFFYLTRKAPGS